MRNKLKISVMLICFLLLLVACGTGGTEETEKVSEQDKEENTDKDKTEDKLGKSEPVLNEKNKNEKKENIEKEELSDVSDTEENNKEEENVSTKSNKQQNSNKKEEKFTYESEKINGSYTSTTALNVREKPDTQFKKVTVINVGDKAKVLEKTTNLSSVWYKISVNGKEGWASSNYLQKYNTYENQKESEKVSVENNTQESAKTSNKSTDKSENTSSDSNEKKGSNLIVENFSTLGNSEQVILVTNASASSSNAKIQAFEKTNNVWKKVYEFSGHVGKNGIGKTKEGDGKSPEGKYSIGFAFGHGSKPNTRLSYRNVTEDIVWVDDSNSKYYNTWQDKSKVAVDWNSAEDMNINQYARGFVINYNANKTPGRGSAIFFHVNGNYGYTLGCTSASKANVERLLSWINPSKSPVIIQTPESKLGNY
ncbi:SH3 domain-containing protein [Oceanobacillus picturae]|uniref:SH3 domain-containing protein n=1 Tax=Oceanobacillus picturae TaxID=171693 RepID=UPI003629B944